MSKQNNQRVAQRPGHLIAVLATVVASLMAMPLAGAGHGSGAGSGAGTGAGVGDATVHPSLWPRVPPAIPVDAKLEARIRALLSRMSVEDKVGQVTQGDINSLTPADVRKYRLGSVLAGGNSDPGGRYDATPAQWFALAEAFHRASMDTTDGRQAIPVLFGIDAVHGHNNVVGATLFPHNIGLGATRDPDLVRRIAEATAEEVRSTGIDWAFAPTLAVPQDDRWGRTYEGYSEHASLVAEYASAAVEGLQGKLGTQAFLDPSHLIATAKHFLGDGGTAGGKDQGDALVSETGLRDIHGAGYPPALRAGVQTVMASFSSWNGEKMHGNHGLLTDVLKQRMGFDGFVVGDWNAHAQVPGCSKVRCAQAINAGIDMIMASDSWREFYANTLAQVKSGEIPMTRLDDAVTRILRVKLRAGMFHAGPPPRRALPGRFELIGSAAHRALARQAVRESLVLLKNRGDLLPLSPTARVLVAGDAADSIAKQSGGWTLTWQGSGTQPKDFPKAQSIWSGLREQIESAGGHAVLSADGSFDTKPDVAIVVFGEEPYAEFQGDIATLAYKSGDDSDLRVLQRLHAQGVPVVSVFLSGRPLWMNREINASDAFVAAWLPGSEGGGIADVLLRGKDGKVAHDFRGKLSYSWPRTAVQTPLNVGQKNYAPQFTYGYGLRYAGHDRNDPGMLSEISGVTGAQGAAGVFFTRGKTAPGWTFDLANETGDTQGVSLVAVDRDAQEDARLATWSRGASAQVRLVAPDPLDLSRETNGDVLLLFDLRRDMDLPTHFSFGLECGPGCSARVPVGADLAMLSKGEWHTYGVPLKCFANAGADMTRIHALRIESDAPAALRFSRIVLGTTAERVMACSTQ